MVRHLGKLCVLGAGVEWSERMERIVIVAVWSRSCGGRAHVLFAICARHAVKRHHGLASVTSLANLAGEWCRLRTFAEWRRVNVTAPRGGVRMPSGGPAPPLPLPFLEEGRERVVLSVLLDEHLEVLVDGGHREQDASARADSAHEVGHDSERTDAHASEGCGSGDVTVELFGERGVTVALHHHLLVAELPGHVLGGRAGNLDPSLGEHGASDEDEDEVDDRVDRVSEDFSDGDGRREVIDQTADGHLARGPSRLLVLPPAEHVDEEVVGVALEEQLRKEVEVRDEGRLEDDGHVGGVEELDRVRALHAALGAVLDWQVDAEALEVDDDKEYEDGRHEVGEVGQILTVKCLLDTLPLVSTRDNQVEESDESALELGAAARVNGGRRKRFPDDGLADVGSNEERDTRAEAIALLQELVENDNDDARDKELKDDQDRVTSAELTHVAVHAGDHVGHRLADGDQNAEELLRAREEGTVLLEALVDIDDLGTREELHHQTRCDDRRDAKLHERASVGSEQHSHPIEGVGTLVCLAAIDWDLAAHKEDEQRDRSPQDLLLERNLAVWLRHLRQHMKHWLHQRKEAQLST
mmetsp:Transcript_50744/g.100971  ORF Transcript_50744/g.100971 Transcript_50744/m.100971 type:complete len:584 (-) Transcript_50744:49-1800(-)